jgi:antiviral helicase SKI2
MILLPAKVNLVLLSATIDSPEQFASWLGDLKQKPIHLISTEYRIVPLIHGMYRNSEMLTVMDNKEYFDPGMYSAWMLWRKAQKDEGSKHKEQVQARRLNNYEDGVIKKKGEIKSYVHELNSLVERLESLTLLPALFFVFSRKDCERYAHAITSRLIDSSDAAAVRHIIKFHLHRYKDLLVLPQYNNIVELLEKGIAYHHSGLIPVLKEIIEILFSRGYIKLLFATETFAVGLNMPTKTAVFVVRVLWCVCVCACEAENCGVFYFFTLPTLTLLPSCPPPSPPQDVKKFDDTLGQRRCLRPAEFTQMAGRAGRPFHTVLSSPSSSPSPCSTYSPSCTMPLG